MGKKEVKRKRQAFKKLGKIITEEEKAGDKVQNI
jgi:hypothetical protein